jgi:DNA-directed RNA polymerase specialized sigma subunit
MALVISPELYRRFKDEILSYTNSRQRYESGQPSKGLSDSEIAKKLGITLEEAVELRCIAELDIIETSRFFEADGWKQDRFDQEKAGSPKDSEGQGNE